MGCVSSSDAGNGTSRTPASDANLQENTERRAATGSMQRELKTANQPSHAGHDTELAASLAGNSGTAVAYHGLLVNPEKLSLSRAVVDVRGKVFNKSVHPCDDGNPVEPISDRENNITIVRGVAMTMPYTIIVGCSFAEDAVKRITLKVFDDANTTVNGWNPESEVSCLNRTPPGKSMKIGTSLIDLFGLVDQLNSVTNGRFDPTTGALTAAFENSIKANARPPLPSELKPLKYGIGWRKRIQRNGNQVSRTNGNTVVDLDGVAKGFVVDSLLSALCDEGYMNCYVDWAGDVRAIGKHPSGRPWRSAVLLPPQLRRMFTHWRNGTLQEMLQSDDIGFFADFSFHTSGEGGAIAASGDYFSIQKYGYHHIAHGEELTVLKASETSVASVCVAASTCVVADACATAAMTFSRVEAAVEFLKHIQSNSPGLISGFCVLNREHARHSTRLMYSSNIFVPAADSDSSMTETKTVDSRKRSGMNEEIMNSHRKKVTRNLAELHFKSKRIIVDSFTPCSMVPEQLVTFISPVSFVSDASVQAASDHNKLWGSMLGLVSTDPNESEKQVRIDMCFRKIDILGESALVVASVATIDLGSATNIQIPHRESVPVLRTMQLNIPRSTYGIASLKDRTKELFRQVPTVVWVLGTKAADQVELAITVTSVTVPLFLKDMICFNIAHSSAFYAGIGGPGSRIRGHALSVTQSKVADMFVAKSNPNVDDLSNLEADSSLTLDCTIEEVESVQDHIVVLARVVDARCQDSTRIPLLWLQGDYIDI